MLSKKLIYGCSILVQLKLQLKIISKMKLMKEGTGAPLLL
jgi:hypothetical protein